MGRGDNFAVQLRAYLRNFYWVALCFFNCSTTFFEVLYPWHHPIKIVVPETIFRVHNKLFANRLYIHVGSFKEHNTTTIGFFTLSWDGMLEVHRMFDIKIILTNSSVCKCIRKMYKIRHGATKRFFLKIYYQMM